MNDLIMGADVSGNPDDENQAKYIALIFGTTDSINRIYRRINLQKIHMAHMNKSGRQKVFQNLEFNNRVLIGLCLHVKRQKTIAEILHDPGFNPRMFPRSKVRKHFDHVLYREIQDVIESIVFPRRCEIKDIIMQCDSDMVQTGVNWGMNTSNGGKAYEIADSLAWCNGHGIGINHCRELDLAGKIYSEMRREWIR